MSDFEKWLRSLNANGKTVYFLGNEHKVSEMAWNHQQAIIDQLNSVLDERTKEWLQAIELGTYFENVVKPLKAENDRLKAQLNNMEACYIRKKKQVEDALSRVESLMVHAAADYENTKSTSMMCAVQELGKALRGES